MGLHKGAVSPKLFSVLGPVPSEEKLDEMLFQFRFRPFEDGTEEERSGFRSWRNPLLDEPEAHFNILDGKALLTILIETRKVPGKVLNAHVQKRVSTVIAEKNLAFLGKNARKSIKEEVKTMLLAKAQPCQKVVEVAWDLHRGMIVAGSPGKNGESLLRVLLRRAFGVELQPVLPVHLAAGSGISIDVSNVVEPISLETKNEE